MIINGTYHHQQQQQQQAVSSETASEYCLRNSQMEDLNNNLDSSMNRNGFLNNGQNEYPIKLKSEKNDLHQTNPLAPKCANCLLPIEDKFICNMMNMFWHEECLTCSQCCCMLNQSCFFKNGQLFCKDDYFKNFGTRCHSCMDLIGANELVMRIETLSSSKQLIYYHFNCFKCLICDKQLQKGEEYILRSEGIYCKMDFERCKLKSHLVGSSPAYSFNSQQKLSNNSNSSFNSQPSEEENSVDSIKYRMVLANQTQNEQVGKKSSSRRVTKRPRTILNAAQRYDFREAFKQSQKPCRKVREHLADKTGLSVRVVQVWFQNERAKMKKMQRRQQQMNKFGELEPNVNKKKMPGKKTKKDTMSNDEDDSMDEEVSEVDSDDFSDDEESLDLDESENRINGQSLPQQVSFQPLQLADSDNMMSASGFHHQPNENECMNMMNIQFNQQQHCQMQTNPINRLYSMQNSYF